MSSHNSSGIYESGSVEIPGLGPLLLLPPSEVFAPNRPAMVVAAQSGEGKTVTAVNMVYANRDVVTGFGYITNTYHSPSNQYLRDMVPEIHVKNWDLDLLCRLWGEILQRGVAISRSVDDRSVDQFIQGRCHGDRTLLAELDAVDTLVANNAQLFPEVSSGKAAIAAHKKLIKLQYIRTHFRADDINLTEQEKGVVRASRSTRPCYLLIIDDVTAQIRSPPKDEINIPTLAEGDRIETKTMKGKDGFDFLMINLLTLARHFAIVGFFVHTFDAFTAPVRGQFGGMMFLGADTIRQACREGTLSPQDKELICAAWDVAKDYPHHKVVLYTNPDLTPHKQRVALCKPEYYNERLPIGVPTYQAVMRNVAMAIDQYHGSEVHRARVQAEKQRLEKESAALARDGEMRPSSQQPQLSQQLSSQQSVTPGQGAATTFGTAMDTHTSAPPVTLTMPGSSSLDALLS